MWTILIVTEDVSLPDLVSSTLRGTHSEVAVVTSVKQFFTRLQQGDINLILYDSDIAPLEGMEAFPIVKTQYPRIPSILLLEQERFEVIRQVLDKGVLFRMFKPVNSHDLRQIIDRVRWQQIKKDEAVQGG